MRYLALDIGTRRTGVAIGDTESRVPLAGSTIHHQSFDELVNAVLLLIEEKATDEVVLGLPLLPSGEEGKQAKIVRDFAKWLQERRIPVSFVDERYSTPRSKQANADISAACAILETKFCEK